MKKIVLEFKKKEFDRALKAHIDHKKAVINVLSEAKKLGVEITEAEVYSEGNLYNYICNQVYTEASKNSSLPENINKLKFLELLDIDLNPLSKSVNDFNRLKVYDLEPKKEDFTRYLQEKDIDLYSSLHNVVDTLNDLAKKNFIRNKLAITQGFASMIVIDRNTTNFKLNL